MKPLASGLSGTTEAEHVRNEASARAPRDLKWFDFWCLFGAGTIALGILLFSIRRLVHFRLVVRTIAFLLVSAPYCALTAAIAVAAAHKARLPILPILEKWWTRALNAQDAAIPLVTGMMAGAVTIIAVRIYFPPLSRFLGSTPPKHHLRPHPIDIICSVILEEILFRLIAFGVLTAALRWIWSRVGSRASAIPDLMANALQALAFGAAHLAADLGGLGGHPWYVRLPLIPQTWSGVVLGWVYWRHGIESAVACHATYDFLIFAFARRLIRVLRL